MTHSRPIQVLLVEDTASARKIAAVFLKIWGCEVTAVENGQDALTAAQQIQFDLIYMDLGLPDIPGDEVGKQIVQTPSNPNYDTPIVALTAETSREKIAICMQAGFKQVLKKPIKEEEHKSIINEYVRKS